MSDESLPLLGPVHFNGRLGKFDWYGVGLDNEPEDSGEGSGTKSISCRDNERIGQVQSLGCNIHDLEYNDPILFSLVNNIANHLPNVFPNGRSVRARVAGLAGG